MCKYCNQEDFENFPEKHSPDGILIGEVFDTCIYEHEDGWYMEFPIGVDIPICYCPFCGERLE